MKISTKGRYALRMMIDMAEQSSGEWISIRDISERQGISVKYLEQIVTHLTRAKLLLSSRGAQGGYRLARTPDQYTAGQILRVIEGDLAPVACLATDVNLCQRCGFCRTVGFWKGLNDVINDYVDSVTLQDLAQSRKTGGEDYSI